MTSIFTSLIIPHHSKLKESNISCC